MEKCLPELSNNQTNQNIFWIEWKNNEKGKEQEREKSMFHLFIGVNSIKGLAFDIGLTGLWLKKFFVNSEWRAFFFLFWVETCGIVYRTTVLATKCRIHTRKHFEIISFVPIFQENSFHSTFLTTKGMIIEFNSIHIFRFMF